MRKITTRLMETSAEKAMVYALRYDYFIASRELEHSAADHVDRMIREARDAEAQQYGTFFGNDLVGCFRVEAGSAETITFGGHWGIEDFVAVRPERVALIGGLCTVPHLRAESVLDHMVERAVAVAHSLEVGAVFFEMCPDLWPRFHKSGLHRKGGTQPDRRTGLPSAIFHLPFAPVAGHAAAEIGWASRVIEGGRGQPPIESDEAIEAEFLPRRRFALVVGGR